MTIPSERLVCYFVIYLACMIISVVAEKQWIYMPVYGWDRQWKQGVWNFMDKVPAERGRIALIGSVLIQMYTHANASVLDIGCAEGALTDFLTPSQRANYLGLDISKVAIAKASKARPMMNFQVALAHEFKTDKKWDVVVFSEMLNYVEHEKVLKQYEQYLTPNGIIIASVYHMEGEEDKTGHILTFGREYFEVVDRLELGGLTSGAKEPGGKRQWNKSRIDVYRPKPKVSS